jgi:CRP/FNR family cyclic AMP-dependent transcriptional regulator
MAEENQGSQAQKKSGLHNLKTGDVLFNDGDPAQSLFIIQKGQLRLYKPKGKGFIEIAVLRAGEVIGEMAYFDDSATGGKRSCSAQAQVPTDVIEISFTAFSKTMESLNPWFKTIINTLASRLRKMNARVKELESNSVSGGYGAGKIDYEFFKSQDTIRALSVLYLVFKSSGEKHPDGIGVHMNTLRFYGIDIFNVIEAKLDAFIELLRQQGLLSTFPDKENQSKIVVIKDLELIRYLLVFFNTQRTLVDEKKLQISYRCHNWLEKIAGVILPLQIQDTQFNLELDPILNEAKAINRPLDLEDLTDARIAGFIGEIIVDKGNTLSVLVYWEKLHKTLPAIRMMNAIKKFNETQSGSNKY